MSLSADFFPNHKQSKLPPSAAVPGVVYNRFHSGHGPSTASTGHLGNPLGHAGYMNHHPDAYLPHPGEAVFEEPEYTPYEPGPPHHFTPMLHAPQPWIPAPDEITYEDTLRAAELTRWAIEEAYPAKDAHEMLPFDHDVMAGGIMGAPDLSGASDVDDLAEATADALMGVAQSDVLDALLLGAETPAPLGYTSLEQIVSEQGSPGADMVPSALGPSLPEQLEEDPLLMNPWGMPGWGPMGPGMGPMM